MGVRAVELRDIIRGLLPLSPSARRLGAWLDAPGSPIGPRRLWAPRQVIRTVIGLMGLKLLILGLAFVQAGPLRPEPFNLLLPHWPAGSQPTWESPLGGWDVGHYLYLAASGYQAGDDSNAFFPLWPWVLRSLGILTGGVSPFAALLLASAMAAAAYFLLLCCAAAVGVLPAMRVACTLHALAPGGLFFCVGYSESLFLLILSLSLYLTVVVGVTGSLIPFVLLPLARPVGWFMLVPLLWVNLRCRTLRATVGLLALVVGMGAYCLYMTAVAGRWDAAVLAERGYPNAPSFDNALRLRTVIAAFCNAASYDGAMDSLLDRLGFVVALCTLPFLWRLWQPAALFAFAVAMIPAFTNWFVSYKRYLMLGLPIFVFWGCVLCDQRSRILRGLVYAALAALQFDCARRFFQYQWAG